MKAIFIKNIVFAALLLLLSYNDYLSLDPITEIKEEQVFSNIEAIEPLLFSSYKPLGFTYIGDLTGTDVYTLPFVYSDGRSDRRR